MSSFLDTSEAKMRKKKRLLLVTSWPPTQFHAGGQRQMDFYSYLKSTGEYELLLYSRNIPQISDQINPILLNQIFDQIFWSQETELSGNEIADLSGMDTFDVVDLQHLNSTMRINSFRKITKKIVYTPMESEIRNFAFGLKRFAFSMASLKLAIREIMVMRKSDVVIAVSVSDHSFIKYFAKRKSISLNTPIPSSFLRTVAVSQQVDFEKRDGVVFVAYFGSQTNIDAINWYISQVHRTLLVSIPDIKLFVVGDRSDILKELYS